MPKVSVIIPIYGVEKYIERCARSLFEQTLDDIEYIFVDDCTKDNSIAALKRVIEDYPNRKSQIKILHHDVNKGLPQARKTGIMVANGEYIAHCDSDDWVDNDMYKAMYDKVKEVDTDLVICNYVVHDGTKPLMIEYVCNNMTIDDFRNDFLLHNNNWAVWNKMFRKKIYDNCIIYPMGNMGEDMALNAQLLQRCNNVTYVDKPFYYYFKNLNSITNKLTADTVLRNFNAIKENTDIVIRAYSHINNSKIRSGILFLQYNIKAQLYPIVHLKEYRNLFLRTCPTLFRDMLFCLDIPLKYKLKYILALMGFYPRKRLNDI